MKSPAAAAAATGDASAGASACTRKALEVWSIGVHRVIDRRLHDRQVAGQEADRRLVVPDGGQDGLVPLNDHVGREQAALVERLHRRPRMSDATLRSRVARSCRVREPGQSCKNTMCTFPDDDCRGPARQEDAPCEPRPDPRYRKYTGSPRRIGSGGNFVSWPEDHQIQPLLLGELAELEAGADRTGGPVPSPWFFSSCTNSVTPPWCTESGSCSIDSPTMETGRLTRPRMTTVIAHPGCAVPASLPDKRGRLGIAGALVTLITSRKARALVCTS